MMPRNRPWKPCTYLVEWSAAGVVKAGYTGQRRWASFVNRGATLHLLVAHETGLAALTLEEELDAILRDFLQPAWTSGHEAAHLLGGRGGGYMECHKGPPEAVAAATAACREHAWSMPGVMLRALPNHPPEQCWVSNARTNGRTNGLTNGVVEVDG